MSKCIDCRNLCAACSGHACADCTECAACNRHICPELEDCAPHGLEWLCGLCTPPDEDFLRDQRREMETP